MRLGFAPIDDDHDQLIGLTNAVRALLEAGATPSEVRRAIVRLGEYAAAHFFREEQIMRRYGCPDREAHATDHAEIARHIDLLTGNAPGATPDAAQAIEFLDAWINEHLVHRDAAAVDHILAQIAANKRQPELCKG